MTFVAVPSKGRLRDRTLELLSRAGYDLSKLHGPGSTASVEGLELIEMRPRDAAAAIGAGTLDAAFLATDIIAEHELDDLAALPLGFSRSELVVASREDDGRTGIEELDGCVVATHLPRTTERFFARRGVDVRVLDMGGSLEGVCAKGIADAIVDLRQTGWSLRSNHLRALEVLRQCEATFVRRTEAPELLDLELRIGAVRDAGKQRYVMLHAPKDRLGELVNLFHGLESPTVLPLAGREEVVAVHFVIPAQDLWQRLGKLRALGASGIVALEPDALLP